MRCSPRSPRRPRPDRMTASDAIPAIIRRRSPRRWVATFAWGALGILAVAAIWEFYKFFGPAEGVVVGATAGETGSGFLLLPRTNDRAMPHIWEMFARLFQPTSGGDTPPLVVS